MKGYTEEAARAVELLRNLRLESAGGLPQELFWLVSSLTPIVNVDLLIVNETGQILLARRDDEFHSRSWHIPGGCVRFGETMIERVHKTAKAEIGTDVETDKYPVVVRDAIRPPITSREFPNERMHFISALFRCRIPENYVIINGIRTENDPGYLKWFDELPDDLVEIQHIYDDILEPWRNK